VFLLNQVVAPGCGDHLLVIHAFSARELSDRGSVTPQLIGTNDLRNGVFTQQPLQECLRSLGIAVASQQDTLHETVFVDSPPQPVPCAIHCCADFSQIPSGTSTGFPMPQYSCEQRAECYAPLTKRLVAHLNAALVQQFLYVTVTEGKRWCSQTAC
jgi:hypothetical protein